LRLRSDAVSNFSGDSEYSDRYPAHEFLFVFAILLKSSWSSVLLNEVRSIKLGNLKNKIECCFTEGLWFGNAPSLCSPVSNERRCQFPEKHHYFVENTAKIPHRKIFFCLEI
jgi:hypothetical protein